MSDLTETEIVEAVRRGRHEGQTAMVSIEDRPLMEIAYITGIDAKPLANRLYRTRKKICKKLRYE